MAKHAAPEKISNPANRTSQRPIGRHALQASAVIQEQAPMRQPEVFTPKFKSDSYRELYRGQNLDVSQFAPILTEEEAIAELGFNSGALQAVIRLPFKQSLFAGGDTPKELSKSKQFAAFLDEDYAENLSRMNNVTVFCFNAPESSNGGPGYYLMGIEQIRQYRDQSLSGTSSDTETSGGVIGLSQGQILPIGRSDDCWLPNVGWDYPLLKEHDDSMRQGYSAVSRHQAAVSIGEQGQLLIQRDEQSAPHMMVGVGRPL